MTAIKTITAPSIFLGGNYEYYLAISSDTLVVLSKERELIEWIRIGKDNHASICAFYSEDEFLECISEISKTIDGGYRIVIN